MKKIFSLIVILCMMIGIVSADSPPPFPFLIDGQITINGIPQIDGFTIKIENIDTGESIFREVRNGAYFYNLNDLSLGYAVKETRRGVTYPGDRIRITACTGNTACVYEFEIVSTNPTRHDFVVNDAGIPTPVPPTPIPVPIIIDKATSNAAKTIASVDVKYGDKFAVLLGNSKLVKLSDSDITFDNNDYSTREELYISGQMQTSIDNVDYAKDVYLILVEDGIQYKYVFTDTIDIAAITEDEPLKITFLGKSTKIIKAESGKVTVISGTEKDVKKGDKITYNGAELEISMIGDGYIFATYNGEGKKIDEGDSEQIGSLEVYAQEVMYSSDGDSMAVIKYGTDIKETVTDGSDYKKSDAWHWIIDMNTNPQYIGISSSNDYSDIEDDYKPLKLGDKIVLPEEYTLIKFNSIPDLKMTGLTFRIKDNLLFAEGDDAGAFDYNGKDYDRVYLKSTGIYDADSVLITTDKVRIGDSDFYLDKTGKIADLQVKLDMSDILYGGVSFATKDDTFMDHNGIIFSDPENAIDEKRGFQVDVPEEIPEATVTIGLEEIVSGAVVPTIPVIPSEKEIVTVTENKYVCPDGQTVNDASKCPAIPIDNRYVCEDGKIVTDVQLCSDIKTPPSPTPTPSIKVVCEDGKTVSDATECVKPVPVAYDLNWWYGIVGAVIGAILMVLGAKYKWLKGLLAAKKKAIDTAKTPEEKKKAIEGALKTVKTIQDRDKEGKYKG